MSDLAQRLRDSTKFYHSDCELKMRCADRIEELDLNDRRYRWIRDGGWMLIGKDRGNGPEWPEAAEVDRLVDDAIAKAKGE